MCPLIPHFANECLNDIKAKNEKWPIISKDLLIEDSVNFVIQINGKKRALLNVERDINEKALLKKVKEDKEIEKFFNNQEIKKTIFVSNRLINIIL